MFSRRLTQTCVSAALRTQRVRFSSGSPTTTSAGASTAETCFTVWLGGIVAGGVIGSGLGVHDSLEGTDFIGLDMGHGSTPLVLDAGIGWLFGTLAGIFAPVVAPVYLAIKVKKWIEE